MLECFGNLCFFFVFVDFLEFLGILGNLGETLDI